MKNHETDVIERQNQFRVDEILFIMNFKIDLNEILSRSECLQLQLYKIHLFVLSHLLSTRNCSECIR